MNEQVLHKTGILFTLHNWGFGPFSSCDLLFSRCRTSSACHYVETDEHTEASYMGSNFLKLFPFLNVWYHWKKYPSNAKTPHGLHLYYMLEKLDSGAHTPGIIRTFKRRLKHMQRLHNDSSRKYRLLRSKHGEREKNSTSMYRYNLYIKNAHKTKLITFFFLSSSVFTIKRKTKGEH